MLGGLLNLAQGDAMLAVAGKVLESQLVPLFAAVRAELLARVTDRPPASFGDKLRAAGWPLDDAAIAVLWSALVASLADEPADA